jgi:hypothetical protein
MGDMLVFVIKGDVSLAMPISFSFIIRDIYTRNVSHFYQRSGHISDINLTETRSSPFTLSPF